MMVLTALVLAAAYVVLRRAYHGTPAVDALGYTIFPASLLLYVQMAYLRKSSAAAQVILVGLPLALLYCAAWGGCILAQNL